MAKRMKKSLSVLLALVLSFALVAGTINVSAEDEEVNDEVEEVTTLSAEPEDDSDDDSDVEDDQTVNEETTTDDNTTVEEYGTSDETIVEEEPADDSDEDEDYGIMTLADDGPTVAMIGDKEYASLNVAVKDANEGETIVIVKDCEISETITVSTTLTITTDGKDDYTIDVLGVIDGDVLNASEISNNVAGWSGGGVYSAGETNDITTLHMYNVMITENEALIGGGIWSCPSGELSIYISNGGAITRNTARDITDEDVEKGLWRWDHDNEYNDHYKSTYYTPVGDDLSFTEYENGQNNRLILAGHILGGGAVTWYQDGRATGIYGQSIDHDVARYDANSSDNVIIPEGTYNTSESLHSEVTDEAYNAADHKAQLYITGNLARHGGGVGSNGGVVIGYSNETSLTVEKLWDDNNDADRPGSINVQLQNRTLVSTDSTHWEYVSNEDEAEYTIPVDGTVLIGDLDKEMTYKIMSGDTVIGYYIDEGGFSATETPIYFTFDYHNKDTLTLTITNGGSEEVTVSVMEYIVTDDDRWADVDNSMVELSAANSWQHEYDELDVFENDIFIEYRVVEIDEDGNDIDDSSFVTRNGNDYYVTYAFSSDEKFDITNTKVTLPEIEKYVADTNYDEDYVTEDEADNDDTLEYMIIVDHFADVDNLVIHDYLDEQLDIDTLKIKSVTLYKNNEDEGKGIDYKETEGECSAECGLNGCSFEISIDDKVLEGLTDDAFIKVIFDITVKEEVKDFDGNLVDEVDNHAGLSYTMFGVSGYATLVTAETFSYGFNIFKYTDEDAPLAGAQFVLEKGSQYAEFVKEDGIYLLSEWVDSEEKATSMVSDENGCIIIEGLHEGTFTVEEVQAPTGYQLLDDVINVTIITDEKYNSTVLVEEDVMEGHTASIKNEPLTSTPYSETSDDELDENGSTPAVSTDEEPVTETETDTVKTNDNTNMLIYVAGLGLSFIVLLGIAYSRRKKSYNR